VFILLCDHQTCHCRAVSAFGLAALAVKVSRAGDVMPNSDERKNQKNLRDYESVGIRFASSCGGGGAGGLVDRLLRFLANDQFSS
jgi:hypothetical protein